MQFFPLSLSRSICVPGAGKPKTSFEFWVSLVFRHHHNQPHLQHRPPGRVQGLIFAFFFPSPLGVCLGLVALPVSPSFREGGVPL